MRVLQKFGNVNKIKGKTARFDVKSCQQLAVSSQRRGEENGEGKRVAAEKTLALPAGGEGAVAQPRQR
jgi:hypothetical protein